jgi:hypothetical protein
MKMTDEDGETSGVPGNGITWKSEPVAMAPEKAPGRAVPAGAGAAMAAAAAATMSAQGPIHLFTEVVQIP